MDRKTKQKCLPIRAIRLIEARITGAFIYVKRASVTFESIATGAVERVDAIQSGETERKTLVTTHIYVYHAI